MFISLPIHSLFVLHECTLYSMFAHASQREEIKWEIERTCNGIDDKWNYLYEKVNITFGNAI
jgi:transposase-like protein